MWVWEAGTLPAACIRTSLLCAAPHLTAGTAPSLIAGINVFDMASLGWQGTSEHARLFIAPCPSFDPCEGIRSGRPVDFPGAGRLPMHCAPVMLAQDPAGLPTIS